MTNSENIAVTTGSSLHTESISRLVVNLSVLTLSVATTAAFWRLQKSKDTISVPAVLHRSLQSISSAPKFLSHSSEIPLSCSPPVWPQRTFLELTAQQTPTQRVLYAMHLENYGRGLNSLFGISCIRSLYFEVATEFPDEEISCDTGRERSWRCH